MPIEYESKIVSLHNCVLDARKKTGPEISQIGNVDEVPLTFDVPLNKTVDGKGAQIVTVETSGPDRAHHTVLLSCCADGTKLPPEEAAPRGVTVCVHDKGWVNGNGMKIGIEKCGPNALEGFWKNLLP